MGRVVLLVLVLGLGPLAAAAETPPLIAGDDWQTVARLIDEQKLRSARAEIDRLLEHAQADSSSLDWARALVVRSFVQTVLAGERAGAASLQAADWPSAATEQTLLHLYLAAALRVYRRGEELTPWPRERIDTGAAKPLDQLTRAEVDSLIDREYLAAWRLRGRMPAGPIGDWSCLLAPGRNLEDGVYDSFAELLTYEWVDYLKGVLSRDSARTSRRSEASLLPLLARAPQDTTAILSPTADPLVRLSQLLDRLEVETQAAGRPAAALEARMGKLRILNDRCSAPSWRPRVADLLSRELEAQTGCQRSTTGFYIVADLYRDAGRRVDALAAAQRGARLFPESEGGRRCAKLAAEIVAPHFSLDAPEVLDPARPALQINYRNMTRLELAAFHLEPGEYEQLRRHSGRKERLEWFAAEPRAVARWSVALVDSADYRTRDLEAPIALREPGQYLLLASDRAPISPNDSLATTLLCQLSPLRVTCLPVAGGELVLVRDCAQGAPVAEVAIEVSLRGADDTVIPLTSARTDSLGLAVVQLQDQGAESERRRLSLRCRWGEHMLFVEDRLTVRGGRRPPAVLAALSTDRAIYRPGQPVGFKVQLCEQRPDSTGYQIRPPEPITVWLQSQSQERLDSLYLRTNDFGSAAGEFTLPEALPLGSYTLVSDYSGYATVEVAEYKRPSFRVELAAPPDSVRFGEPVQIRGRALYYFGQPVGGGQGSYRIRRELRYAQADEEEFRRASGRSMPPEPEITGSFTLDAAGAFTIEALPSLPADVPAVRSLSQHLSISVEVTSAAGETQSAHTQVVAALVALRALIDPAPAFVRVGDEAKLTVTRLDVQGWALSGEGEYEIRQLLPSTPASEAERKRLRDWLTGEQGRHGWEVLCGHWTLGDRVVADSLRHGENGEARIRWRPRAGGVYRLIYRSRDSWGALYETSRDILVVDPATSLALPLYLIEQSRHFALGDPLAVAYGAAEPGQHLYLFELRQEQSTLLAHVLSDGRPRILSLPIAERQYRGFALALLGMGDDGSWQCVIHLQPEAPRRTLRVLAENVDDGLTAGAPTTWTFRVVDADSLGVAAELCLSLVDASLNALVHQYWDSSLRARLGQRWGEYLAPRRTLHERVSGSALWGWRWGSSPEPQQLERPTLYSPWTLGLRGRFAQSVTYASALTISGARGEDLYIRGGRKGEVSMVLGGVSIGDLPTALMEAREDFRETALYLPQLRSDAEGRLRVHFTAPEAPGAWQLKLDAVSPQLALGELKREVRTVRPLTVRLHLPRFLVGGDTLQIKAALSNAFASPLAGDAWLSLERADSQPSALAARRAAGHPQRWQLAPGATQMLTWTLVAPDEPGDYAVRMEAAGDGHYDGERRQLPVLSARTAQSQTTSAILRSGQEQRLVLPTLAQSAEAPDLRHHALAVSITAQPLAAALTALQWLLACPYATTDLVAERLVLCDRYAMLLRERPALRALATQLAADPLPPARASRTGLAAPLAAELPWEWRGLDVAQERSLVDELLDEQQLRTQRILMLKTLAERQAASGGFTWFAGGREDLATTLRVLTVLALIGRSESDRDFARESDRDLPRRAWSYVAAQCEGVGCTRSLSVAGIAELLYILTEHRALAVAGPTQRGKDPAEPSYAGAFAEDDLLAMQTVLREHWRELPLVPRAQAALALRSLGDEEEAELIMASVLDLVVKARDGSRYWDEFASLGTADAVAAHAFLLRAALSLGAAGAQTAGLLDWLILNRELSGWGSTRATAEALLTMATGIAAGTALTADCRVDVRLGTERERYHFRPDAIVADPNLHVTADAIRPDMLRGARLHKQGAGSATARLTWYYESAQADLASAADGLAIERRVFLRRAAGSEWVLVPLAECGPLSPGDEVEVQLVLTSDQPVDFVHIRDPRPAGLEPERVTAGTDWQGGSPVRVEPRDTSTHYFMTTLSAGRTTLSYRLRAVSAGRFRAAPASLRPFYRPDQVAYSTTLAVSIR